jgi:uncharacterized protein (TIGR02452 family)
LKAAIMPKVHHHEPDSNVSSHRRQTIGRLSARSSEPRQGLTFSRGWLVQISKQTLQIAEIGQYTNRKGETVHIEDAFKYAMSNSVHYHSSHTFDPDTTTNPMFESTEYYVCYGSSLQVASRLNDVMLSRKEQFEIGILNSASGKHPEKFLRGTISQEEGFCRSSLLYPCLAQYKDRPHYFYHVNNTPKYQESSSSCAIFCPRVPVIRDDSLKAELLDSPLSFSFVSIPSPNAFVLGAESDDERPTLIPKSQTPEESDRNEAYESMSIDSAMRDRLFRALSIFAEQGCTDLVLCAFGCGAHGNDPQQMAFSIKDILSNELKGRFRVVAFAIQPSRKTNFESFVEVFGQGCSANVACVN